MVAGMSETVTHPRHDPCFKDTLLADLITHQGQYRPLGRLYCPDVPSWDRCCAVRDAVVYWRRNGYEIEGDRRQGYRLVAGQLPLAVGLS